MNFDKLQKMMEQAAADKSLFDKALAYSLEYSQSLETRPVFPDNASLEDLSQFTEAMPEKTGDSHEIIDLLHRYGSPATVAQTGGRYFGFVNGSLFAPVLAAKWLADFWDQSPALYVSSPVVSHLEAVCEKWLVDLLGLPDKTVMGLVSGTSMATICGVAAGRDQLLKNLGWDVQLDGLMGAPPLNIVVGEQVHATVYKGLSLLGLGKNRVTSLPVDDQGCILPESLASIDINNSTIVLLQAGNVCTGGFDPFEPLCQQARYAGAWVHIDGAFGLWAACSDDTKHLTSGIELADSWSVDAHKTLNAPYDCGIVLCRNKEALVSAMQASGSYILYGDKREGMMYTPEMSRRARGVDLWATLKTLGREGVDALISGLHRRAVLAAEGFEREGFRLLNKVVFNQVLIDCGDEALTKQTLENLQQSGECWAGGAVWNGREVIRISVCSWATTVDDIDRLVKAFVQARNDAVK